MELGDASSSEAPPPCPRKREMLKYSQFQMISTLQSMQCDDGMWRGLITIIAKRFNVACSTVYQLWERVACMHAMGDIISPEINSWKNCRKCAIYLTEIIQDKEGVKNLPLWKRCTQRKLAMLMGVLKTTVHHWIVGLTICVHCNSLKPVLTEENKVAWLLMALHFSDPVNPTKYHDMVDQIHLDEKCISFSWRTKTQNAASNTNPT